MVPTDPGVNVTSTEQFLPAKIRTGSVVPQVLVQANMVLSVPVISIDSSVTAYPAALVIVKDWVGEVLPTILSLNVYATGATAMFSGLYITAAAVEAFWSGVAPPASSTVPLARGTAG